MKLEKQSEEQLCIKLLPQHLVLHQAATRLNYFESTFAWKLQLSGIKVIQEKQTPPGVSVTEDKSRRRKNKD